MQGNSSTPRRKPINPFYAAISALSPGAVASDVLTTRTFSHRNASASDPKTNHRIIVDSGTKSKQSQLLFDSSCIQHNNDTQDHLYNCAEEFPNHYNSLPAVAEVDFKGGKEPLMGRIIVKQTHQEQSPEQKKMSVYNNIVNNSATLTGELKCTAANKDTNKHHILNPYPPISQICQGQVRQFHRNKNPNNRSYTTSAKVTKLSLELPLRGIYRNHNANGLIFPVIENGVQYDVHKDRAEVAVVAPCNHADVQSDRTNITPTSSTVTTNVEMRETQSLVSIPRHLQAEKSQNTAVGKFLGHEIIQKSPLTHSDSPFLKGVVCFPFVKVFSTLTTVPPHHIRLMDSKATNDLCALKRLTGGENTSYSLSRQNQYSSYLEKKPRWNLSSKQSNITDGFIFNGRKNTKRGTPLPPRPPLLPFYEKENQFTNLLSYIKDAEQFEWMRMMLFHSSAMWYLINNRGRRHDALFIKEQWKLNEYDLVSSTLQLPTGHCDNCGVRYSIGGFSAGYDIMQSLIQEDFFFSEYNANVSSTEATVNILNDKNPAFESPLQRSTWQDEAAMSIPDKTMFAREYLPLPMRYGGHIKRLKTGLDKMHQRIINSPKVRSSPIREDREDIPKSPTRTGLWSARRGTSACYGDRGICDWTKPPTLRKLYTLTRPSHSIGLATTSSVSHSTLPRPFNHDKSIELYSERLKQTSFDDTIWYTPRINHILMLEEGKFYISGTDRGP